MAHGDRLVDIVDEGAFGDFQLQRGGRQAAVAEGVADHAGQVGLAELASRQVDRQPQR
ncbi:hypothetical protein SDC9_139067 [bioreactor metagenome]|uniref:Uncharacterized protein n=1 Tax=bioreactor metagenome TaxID=1076179 RepID=A0A645DTL8_9ZZZZ